MKKSVLAGLIGITLGATATSTLAQGGIVIGNYQAPFNPVMWPPAVGSNLRVRSDQGVSLSLWYSKGVLTAEALTSSVSLTWNTAAEANGYAGYYNFVTVTLSDWLPGDTYTFQVRASGNTPFGVIDEGLMRSVLWQENENIRFIGGDPVGLPGVSTYSIGISIPEPQTAAMILLGACLFSAKRRSHFFKKGKL